MLGMEKLVRVGESSGIPNVDAAMAKEALDFHNEIKNAVSQNRRQADFAEVGYSLYPVSGMGQDTKLSARLEGDQVKLLHTYEGKNLRGDGTVPSVSAIPVEMSDNPEGTMYASTKHASLQNSGAVLDHLVGVLAGVNVDLNDFKDISGAKLSLEVDDGILGK